MAETSDHSGTVGALGSDFPAILVLAKQQDENKLDTKNNGKSVT